MERNRLNAGQQKGSERDHSITEEMCHSAFIGNINKVLFRLPGAGADFLALAFVLLDFICFVSWWCDSAEREHSAGM